MSATPVTPSPPCSPIPGRRLHKSRFKPDLDLIGTIFRVLLTVFLLSLPALVCVFSFPAYTYRKMFFGKPPNRYALDSSLPYTLFWGSALVSSAYLAYYACHRVVAALPRFLAAGERARNRVAEERVAASFRMWSGLSRSLGACAASLVLAVGGASLFTFSESELSALEAVKGAPHVDDVLYAVSIFSRSIRFFALATVLNLIAQVLTQQLAFYFHCEFYADRLVDNGFAVRCIEELAERYRWSKQKGKSRQTAAEKRRNVLSAIWRSRSPSPMALTTPHATPTSAALDIDMDNRNEVGEFASFLFDSLTAYDDSSSSESSVKSPLSLTLSALGSPTASNVSAASIRSPKQPTDSTPSPAVVPASPSASVVLTVGHLIPVFGEGKGHRLFSLLDTSCRGDLCRADFISAIQDILREEAVLDRMVTVNNRVIVKLSRRMLGGALLVFALLSAPLFSKKAFTSIATIGTIVLTLKFMFSSEIVAVFNGLVFVIFTHPFDIGDYIRIQDDLFRVEDIGLWGTQLRGAEDRCTYVTNSSLAKKEIGNLRRSGYMRETIYLELKASTTDSQLLAFEDALNIFLDANEREFQSGVALAGLQWINAKTFKASIVVAHRCNFQDREQLYRRNRLLTGGIRSALSATDIQLADFDWQGRWPELLIRSERQS